MRFLVAICSLALAACGQMSDTPSASVAQAQTQTDFQTVVRMVEPVAEARCRVVAPQRNCDFEIVVDDRPGRPANARQSYAEGGTPVLTITQAMIAETQTPEELAFVLAHVAGHHIAGLIPRLRLLATTGEDRPDALALQAGGSETFDPTPEGVALARGKLHAFELEADAIGAQIIAAAGNDPLTAAAIFGRLPDPGAGSKGTHPSNQARVEAIRQAVN